MVEILKLMLGRDSEDETWSRFLFELAIWLWQDELNPRVRCAFGNVYYSEGNSGAYSWWSTSTTSKPERVVIFPLFFLWLVVFLKPPREKRISQDVDAVDTMVVDGRLSLKNIKIFLRCSDVWRLVTRQSPVSMFMSPSDFAHKHDATHRSSFALSSTNVVRQTYSFGQRRCPVLYSHARHSKYQA